MSFLPFPVGSTSILLELGRMSFMLLVFSAARRYSLHLLVLLVIGFYSIFDVDGHLLHMCCMNLFVSIFMFNAVQSRAPSSPRRLGIRGQRRNSREFDLNSCESRPAIATATRDQRTRHNALLRPKHNWRSAVSDHTALRDAAAWIPHPSILQRLANRQLFLLDHSRRTQGWQPGSRHLRH
jgi:hypothetical protein